MNILFVCTGNTCRSPIAAALAQNMADSRSLPITCSSAGLSAFLGDRVNENTVAVLKDKGLTPLRGDAVLFDKALAEAADRIYVCSEQHLDFISMRFAEYREKSFLLGNGISDPFGREKAVYAGCLEEIEKALTDIFDELSSDKSLEG